MKNFVITIARGYGSGGRTIGKMLAEKLGIEYYDKELIRLASEQSGINEALFGQTDEKIRNVFLKKLRSEYRESPLPPNDPDFVSDKNLFKIQSHIIKELAKTQSCVIVGRCADYVLRDMPNVVKVFVFASYQACVDNVVRIYGISEREAERIIDKTDRNRSAYYKYYTGRDWDKASNYDLCLNSSDLGFEKCVEIISEFLKIKNS